MTSKAVGRGPILGSLRSADGKGVVRMVDRFDTDIDDVWSALTDPSRQPAGTARSRATFVSAVDTRARLFSSGWEGTGRVEGCEPRQRLVVRIKDADESDESVIEAMLTADADQTIVVWRNGSCPWTCSPRHGAGVQTMSRPGRSPRGA